MSGELARKLGECFPEIETGENIRLRDFRERTLVSIACSEQEEQGRLDEEYEIRIYPKSGESAEDSESFVASLTSRLRQLLGGISALSRERERGAVVLRIKNRVKRYLFSLDGEEIACSFACIEEDFDIFETEPVLGERLAVPLGKRELFRAEGVGADKLKAGRSMRLDFGERSFAGCNYRRIEFGSGGLCSLELGLGERV